MQLEPARKSGDECSRARAAARNAAVGCLRAYEDSTWRMMHGLWTPKLSIKWHTIHVERTVVQFPKGHVVLRVHATARVREAKLVDAQRYFFLSEARLP